MGFVFLVLAKSIKRRPAVYYCIFALPAIIFTVRQITSAFGVTLFDFPRGSVMGSILREYVHVSGFAYPLLIIIMYIGALPVRHRLVKRLMMIRKELSIISGFPVLMHAWVRLKLVPSSFDYFFGGNDAEVSNPAAFFSNSAYLLGVVMATLFLLLWVTSFDTVHKWLGAANWKKIQRLSYILYAMLFIHSVFLNIGRLIGSGGHGGAGKHGAGAGNMTFIAVVALVSTCLVFASYIILRVRKVRRGF